MDDTVQVIDVDSSESVTKPEVTLEELAHRMDMFGEQMNWLCENLAQLFQFVNAMGASGGGIRGLMKAMKETPELKEQLGDES